MEHSFSLPLNRKHLEQIPRDCQLLFGTVYIVVPYPTEYLISSTRLHTIQDHLTSLPQANVKHRRYFYFIVFKLLNVHRGAFYLPLANFFCSHQACIIIIKIQRYSI